MDGCFETAVEAIYDSSLDPSRLPYALQQIADYLGDLGASIAWARDSGAIGTIVSPSQKEEHSLYEKGGWNARDLRVARALERGYFFNGVPFTDRHICSDDEVLTAPIYAEFLAPLGISWVGSVSVSPDPRLGVLLNIHRSSTRKPFSDSELSTIGRFGRHLERSLRLSIRMLDCELVKEGLGEALKRLSIGVFVLDSLGRVVFANPAAAQFLGDGLAIAGGRLVAEGPGARPILETAIKNGSTVASVDVAANVSPVLIDRQDDKRPFAIYLLPLTSALNPIADFLTHARLIVLAISAEADAPADPTLLRDLLGLTLGEARVAALVGSGLAPREAAQKLGITEQTARWALKQVFSKTGVSRQSELVGLLSRLALH